MRSSAVLALLSFASFFTLAASGCSAKSSSSAASTSDGGGDDAASGIGSDPEVDAGVQGDPSTSCGAPPYVTLGITVKAQSATGDSPLPGARFTTPLCPGRYQVSDADGKLGGLVSKGVAFYGRFEAPNYTKMLTPEQLYQADDATIEVKVLPGIFTALIPKFDAQKPTIFIGAFQDGGHGACDTLDGVSFSVNGHPEATVVYYSAGAVPSATSDTVTTTSGRASVTGLEVGDAVTLSASKAGCEVVFVHGANTGRVPLETGYVTFVGAYVHDLPGAKDAAAD